MEKGTYSILGYAILASVLVFFLSGAFAVLKHAMVKSFRLRLSAPTENPPLHVEAFLQVTNPLTFYAKRTELRTFLDDHINRGRSTGYYGILMDAIVKATEEYQSLPASSDDADIVLGAIRISQAVDATLKRCFDEKLAPFGVRIGGVRTCALNTKPA